jgi:hypothetical protein
MNPMFTNHTINHDALTANDEGEEEGEDVDDVFIHAAQHEFETYLNSTHIMKQI